MLGTVTIGKNLILVSAMTNKKEESLAKPYPELSDGSIISGYKINRIKKLEEISAWFYELDHIKTGAKHIHISNDDKENTFGVAFKTVPSDSTGVAHILEHTALCGSEKYNVRDPFFSMIKRSLNTFMNAFTASDWTMYPFSTQNKKDYYNLMGVYLDAAFFPNLDELSFKQEGHRLELEKKDGQDDEKLVHKGVVYNEMKGAMSSPNQVMVRSLMNALYPHTTYSNNSGGDPAVIPNLTHDELIAFHKRHYHPSNSFFYTYGNLSLEEHLSFIDENVLDKFDKIFPNTEVPLENRWDEPKIVAYKYPLGEHENPEKKCQACVAWLTADIKDSFETLSLIILEHILLGNSASPLRKALIDSGLGSSLSDGTGYDPDNRGTMFACGLKNVTKDAGPKIEKIIFDVLESLVKNGIDRDLIDSAIHQIEFHRKEITNSPYPYGIKLLLSISGSWFHGGDPVNNLQMDSLFSKLEEELNKGPFFESQIKKYFLDNPHRVQMSLLPDKDVEEIENRRVREKLDKIQKGLAPADIEKIIKDTSALKALQENEEDLSCLPTIELEEIPSEIVTVEASKAFSKLPITCYPQPTSGIFYYSSVIKVEAIPDKLIQFIPFFCSAFNRMGTSKNDYIKLAQLIDAYTGGIGLSSHARTKFNNERECLPFISFSGKCLNRNIDNMYGIIEELLTAYRFEDLERMKNLLKEYQAGMESSIVSNGHRLAISLSTRNLGPASYLSEVWHGINQLKFIKDLNKDAGEERFTEISSNLTDIANILLNSDGYEIAVVGEEKEILNHSDKAVALKNGLAKSRSNGNGGVPVRGDNIPVFEGWYTQSSVSFVAKSLQVPKMGHKDAPALSLISKIMRSLYLHREIREKGGAYGGFALYNSEDGLFSFASYRDPHIINTLSAFEGAEDFIRSGNYKDEDVKEAILQVCSDIDKPEPPGFLARKAFYRKLVGLSDEVRREYKSRLLGLKKKDIVEAAEKYFNKETMSASIAVISGKEKLEDANKKLEGEKFTLKSI